ncbi:acyltransferase [Sphingomonas sp. LB-2]|uniref:acyltransferase family protein n=1 Tax=Sphingomonas caeni TaxID=2984949 RepID=UPI00222E71B0|nr:acyltransferase family protein [Sphingomonas caeni]MCW3847947.1 acyltransferase [Sphingomonas caeni]
MSGPAPQPKLGFRADINGLRAIAVLAVLAFHFGVPPFRSGFTGVDVFFVISGYLMTGIILGRLGRHNFSVPGFYLDRARRIVPALLVLVTAVLALGWFILLPDEYIILSKHAGSAVTFASNLLFWKESGYFDPGVDQKWLLHSWSLSVEWQFYLLYPLLLLAIAKLAPAAWLRPILALAALASFGVMVALSLTTPDAGFYLLPPRAWEMLAGGLVFTLPPLAGPARRIAQLAGLAMILASALAFAPSDWPNAWTLLPVLGTALVILAGATDSRITGNAVMARIGLDSYSIYLWHWPLVVLLHRSGHFGDWRWTLAALAASFLLGHLSWRFVERIARPATAKPHIHTSPIASTLRAHAGFVLPVLALAVVSAGIWKARGVPQRFSPEVQAAAADATPAPLPGAARCYADIGGMPDDDCTFGTAGAPVTAIVLGDSQADAALPGIVAALPAGTAVRFSAYSACPPVLGARPTATASRCGAFLDRTLAPLAAPRATPLILIGRWTYYAEADALRFPGGTPYRDALYRSMCRLAQAGPTYAMLPLPEFPWWVSRELAHRLIADPHAPDIAYPVAEYRTRNAAQIEVLRRAGRDCGLVLLDPEPVLCPEDQCMGSRDRRALFRDEQHVSGFGARTLAPLFAPVFMTVTDQSSTANSSAGPRK